MEALLVNEYCDDLFHSIRRPIRLGYYSSSYEVENYIRGKIASCAIAQFLEQRSLRYITLEPVAYNRGCWVVDIYARGSEKDLMYLKLSLGSRELENMISKNIVNQMHAEQIEDREEYRKNMWDTFHMLEKFYK